MASGKEKYRFDTELLITAIEQKPCIWDTSSEEYKNRDTKNKAWEEVAQILLEDFENFDETKQQEAIKLIQQRWKSARDAYRRDRSKLRTSKSGQAAKTFKKYIFFENLQFLNKTLDLNDTDTNLNIEESQNVENISENEDAITEPLYEEERVNTETKKRKKKVDIDEKLMEFLSSGKKSEHNGNRAFLESLLPTLDTFDEAKSLQFRAEVLRILMEIKKVPAISQIPNAQQRGSYPQYNVSYGAASANFNSRHSNNSQLSMFNSSSGCSDINSRPRSSLSCVSSPLSSNEYGYTPNMPLQDGVPIENQHDEMGRPTLLELTGVDFGRNVL